MAASRYHRRQQPCRLRLELLEGRRLLSTYYVAPTGNDSYPGTLAQPFATIGHALNAAAQPGDAVDVCTGTYHEHLVFPHGGSAQAGDFTLQAYPGDSPVLDGTGLKGGIMILIQDLSYIEISGLEICNNTQVSDGSGIRILGSGSNIELLDNKIHDMHSKSKTSSAMGITVYGTETTPISNLTIEGNQVYNCDASNSECLTLNGNVDGFQITNNVVHDVNNIGICMIGGEPDVNANAQTRDGLVQGNVVYKCNSNYGGGYAGGIYVDGGMNITIIDNVSYQNDLGLEVGCENAGVVASGIVVENNLIYDNGKSGLVFGGYQASVGRVENCLFLNNTVYDNDTLNSGNGQLFIQYASNNSVIGNIFWASSNDVLTAADAAGNSQNVLDRNLWYAADGADSAIFYWNSAEYDSFSAYQTGTKEDADSLFADPKFVDAAMADFHLTLGSPAIDADTAASGQFAPNDFDGRARPIGLRPDIGAYEFGPAATVALGWHAPLPNDTLTATVTVSNVNRDPVALTYVWAVNGAVKQTHAGVTALTDKLDLGALGNVGFGDAVTVEVTPNDGSFSGTAVSDTATVVDAASWLGTGSDAGWGTAANWGGRPLQANDPLVFSGSNGLSNANNLPAGMQFDGITFQAGAGAFTLAGNAVSLGGDIANNSSSTQTIDLPLVLTGTRTLDAVAGNMIVGGAISETGGHQGIIITGPETVTFSGANTFSGSTTVSSGTLIVTGASSLPTGSSLTVGAGGTLVFGSTTPISLYTRARNAARVESAAMANDSLQSSAVPSEGGPPSASPLPSTTEVSTAILASIDSAVAIPASSNSMPTSLRTGSTTIVASQTSPSLTADLSLTPKTAALDRRPPAAPALANVPRVAAKSATASVSLAAIRDVAIQSPLSRPEASRMSWVEGYWNAFGSPSQTDDKTSLFQQILSQPIK